ncbi:ferredoxin [Streptomyces sp. NPDC087420]|uniref:ferredoxin n=1 Tax=Streptomyces sp. NPDC087420 TaxID=3365785 RepID=UPI0038339CA5
MTLYFDPLASVTIAWHLPGVGEDRLWLNVPGPFYDGATDTCWTGRVSAPDHVLYGGEYLTEYVYRQPKAPADTALLIEAADQDPLLGYGCDGDSRWTPEAVREWWSERGRVTCYLSDNRSAWDESEVKWGQGIGAALRDFESYIAGGLATDLRISLYWLEELRSPSPDDRLPEL